MPHPAPPRHPSGLCLGLRLSNREIGYALATRTDVLDFGVLNIRKLHSATARQTRFQQVIGQLLDRQGPDQLALLAPLPHQASQPLIQSFQTWLVQVTNEHRIPLHTIEPSVLKPRYRTTPAQPITHRFIAQQLCRRFPALHALTPPDPPPPARGALQPGQTVTFRQQQRAEAKTRYWNQMFLALAAAVHVLDDQHTDVPRPIPQRIPPAEIPSPPTP